MIARRWYVVARCGRFEARRLWTLGREPMVRPLLCCGPYSESQAQAMAADLNRPKRKAGQPGNAEPLLRAAKEVLSWIEAEHRPPVRDELECGRMARVRLHALADLRDAVQGYEGAAG